MAVPTLLRPQHKLGDFFFQSDMEKLHGNNFPGAMSGNINTMNVTMMGSDYYSGDNYYYTSPVTSASSPYSGKIMNVNYAYNVHNNSGEIVDNAEKSFSLKKAAKSERKESKKKYVETRRKKYGKKKPEPIVEDVEMTEVEDRVKESNLQTEITREQEYQDMINMLYNNPELWEQHHQSLQHQPALHQCEESEMDQHVMKHNAPMYFITHQHDLQFHHDQHQHVIQQKQTHQLHHSLGLEQEFHHDQPQQVLQHQHVIQQQQPQQLHHSLGLEKEFHHDQPQQVLQHQHVIQQHQPQQLHHSQGLEKEFHHDQPLKTSTPTAMFLSETSSDYFSDSSPSSECPSDDESSSEVLRSSLIQSPASEPRWPSSGKFNFYDTALSWAWESEEPYSAPLELDEELNNLVLSIISE